MKRKLKSILVLVILLFLSLSIVGYINKTRILSVDRFSDEAKKSNLKIKNTKDEFESDIIKDAVIAYNKYGDYQIEYIIFNDSESAKSAFLINKNEFINEKDDTSVEESSNKKYSSMYELTTNNKYMYISRINNSLLYINTDITYKEETKNIVDKINY